MEMQGWNVSSHVSTHLSQNNGYTKGLFKAVAGTTIAGGCVAILGACRQYVSHLKNGFKKGFICCITSAHFQVMVSTVDEVLK
jgi:hypothetical protein